MAADTANNFSDLTQPELVAVADRFAVDVKKNASKAAIIKDLTDMGVDFQQYRELIAVEAAHREEVDLMVDQAIEDSETVVVQPVVVAAPVVAPTEVLIKMDRKSRRFETNGYTFTDKHPFVLVPAAVANAIFEREVGFRTASPRELEDFYGR